MVLAVSLVCLALYQNPTTPLSGIVVGPNGQPVAGADVLLGGLPVRAQKVVARGKSDAQGRFTIQRPTGLVAENRFDTPVLWVVKPGFRLGYLRLFGLMPKDGEDVRIALASPGKGEVHVEDPDGRPVPGARIRLEWFGREQINVPEAVEDLIEATTDRDGRAVIEAATNDEIAYVDVHAKGFGIQGRPFRPVTSQPKRVRLRQVAALEGRLQAGDPAMTRGWRVFAYTRVGDRWGPNSETTGFAIGTTDAEGRFAFPAIAPGRLELVFNPPRDLPVMAEAPDDLAVAVGRSNSVVVPLRKLVTITGLVRERGTGRPVPGAEMGLAPAGGGMVRPTKTDAQGRYSFSTLPGRWHVSLSKVPPTLVAAPGQPWKEFTLSQDQGKLELEPWEAIPAAPPLRFVVRDENGRPAAHASIIRWSGSAQMPDAADDRGEFVATGIQPGSELSVDEIRLGDRMTDGPVKAMAGAAGPIEVTIRPGLAIALAGRVVGPDGTPIADAQVHVQYRDRAPQGGVRLPQNLAADSRTGTDGTFRTPKDYYRKDREYRVELVAEGFFLGYSEWASADRGDLITLPDVVLRPRPARRRLEGRVVDRGGKGIARVTVFQPSDSPARTEAITDDAGRFRFDDVPGGPALVFAEKTGYRFGGAVVGPGATNAEIRLARNDEPPISIPKPVPPPLSRAEERRIARELLAPLIAPARDGMLGHLEGFVVPALARVDPDRVLEMLENRVLSQPAQVLAQVALGQYEDDPKAAIATIEADRDPSARAEGVLALVDGATDTQGKPRLELIDRALAEARRVESQQSRLRLLGKVADCYLELGLVDRATPVLRMGRSIIASLPKDQYFFEAEEFARALAVIDRRTAMTILERKGRANVSPIDPRTQECHRGEVAVRLAAMDPAEAERLVPRAVPNLSDVERDACILRICQRMAPVDLPRARKILEQLDKPSGPNSHPRPEMVAEGLALMAAARAETDPAGARALLDEAYDRLRKLASDSQRNNAAYSANRMAALLPLVERIDPDHLEERLWLAAAHREVLHQYAFLGQLQVSVVLAALVARYDRPMAAAIIAPALDRMPELLVNGYNVVYYQSTVFKAVAVYDPRAIAVMVRGLPASARRRPPPQNGWQGASIDAMLRLAAAEALGLSFDEQYRKILGLQLGFLPFRITF